MNCPEAQIAMRASIEREVPLDARTKAHVATCEDCSEDYGDWALDHALRLQDPAVPQDDFVDRAIEFAIREVATRRRRRFAMAASIAVIGVALGLLFAGVYVPSTPTTNAQVTLTAHEGKTVSVVIDSPAAQTAATVTIELADNLELAGFPNERKIKWQTNLSEGKNLLALPLTLTTQAESHFNVVLSVGDTTRDVRVAVHSATQSPSQADA
jgi:phosphoglycolate phosphatase-like HAD superfamily hydrolase